MSHIQFEKVVTHLLNAQHNVKLDCMYDDNIVQRQIDGYLEFQPDEMLPKVRIGIECRKRNRPVSITQIDAFASVVNDCKLHVGMMVSFTGYQSGAILKAKSANIQLYSFRQCEKRDLDLIPYDGLDGPVEFSYRLDCMPVSHDLSIEEKGLLASGGSATYDGYLYDENGKRINTVRNIIKRNLEKEVLLRDKKAGIFKFDLTSKQFYTHEVWKGEKLVMKVQSLEVIFNAEYRVQVEFKEPSDWWIFEDVIDKSLIFLPKKAVDEIRTIYNVT
ncbi:MAG: restriction endonuclease [Candidatus Thorarchaeota archaeon]